MKKQVLLTAAVLASLGVGSVYAQGSNIGYNNTSNGTYGMVIGSNNTAEAGATSSFVLGDGNTVKKANSFAFGQGNVSDGENSIVGGDKAKAIGRDTIAFGSSAQALTDYTIAVGSQARANGENTIAFGNGSYASNMNATSIGRSTAATGIASTAVGYGNKAKNDYATAMGYQNVATGDQSSAFGSDNEVTAANAVVVGNHSVASGTQSFVGGFKSKATNDSAVAVGNQATASANHSLAIGTLAEANKGDSVAIGHSAIASGELSTAIGSNAEAKDANTIAIGVQSKVAGTSSIGIGRDNNITGHDTTVVGANNGTISYDAATGAVITDHTITADQSAVFGYNNVVQDNSKEQLIFGSNSTTKGQGATVVGSHAAATAIDALALGNNTVADQANSVAIGSNSVTELQVGTSNIKDNASDIRFSNSSYAGSTPDSVVSFGTNGRAGAGGVTSYTRQLQNLAAGRVSATSTDGINGSQLYDVALEAQKYNTMANGTNTTVTSTDNTFGRKEFKVNVNKDLMDMNSVNFGSVTDPKHSVTNKDGMITFDGDKDTKYTANGMAIEDRNNLDTAKYDIDGMIADSNGKHVEFTTTNISAGDQQIHNVTAGTLGTDAVNVNQLNSAVNNISNHYDALQNKVNKNHNETKRGIAGTAALAALHPLDFDPDHKLDVMAGYGHFHNANSVALGMTYRPNEDLMFTVGSTVGNGDTVVNAGISYKVGAKSDVSRSKVSVAKDVADMKREMEAIKAQNAKITAILNAVLGADLPQDQTNMFPDVPANHWAYEAVNDMAKRGLVIGYEDGQFKGDRTMTRYEFAMIVERTIQKAKELNTSIDGRLVDEFKPELLRFEIQKNGSLERVHTLKSNKEVQRDSYGTIITK